MLKFQTLTPFFGSLERDPVHHSVYYLAVDSETEPLLLHMALAAAPTSSIYYKPLLIGRMRRPNGPEIVINAIPFGPRAHQNIETFAARINPAFYPKPQGARTTITVEEDYPAAFDTFRAIQKRTGKNFAALAGDYHAAMCAAIRAGWRSGVHRRPQNSAPARPPRTGRFSRYAVTIPAGASGIDRRRKVSQQIRQARAALKISRGFDLELDAATPMTPQVLRNTLEGLKDRGHVPQLVYPGPFAEKELDEMAATANTSRSPSVSATAESPPKPCAPSPKPWRKARLPGARRRRSEVRGGAPAMMRRFALLLPLALFAPAQQVSLINTVRKLIDQHDVAGAERVARSWQANHPASPELAAALSWVARGALAAKNLDQADALAGEAGKMASRFLIGQKLDDDPWLPTAVGASHRGSCPGAGRARRTPRSRRLPAEPAQTIRRHLPARADPQKHQPAGSGG